MMEGLQFLMHERMDGSIACQLLVLHLQGPIKVF